MDSLLRESEARLRAIVEMAVEGIITIDERGIVESINPAGCRIFGFQPEEVVGRNVSMLMPSPDREKHDGYIANYIRTGQAKIIGIGREVVGQRKDGTCFPMELSISEVRLELTGNTHRAAVFVEILPDYKIIQTIRCHRR